MNRLIDMEATSKEIAKMFNEAEHEVQKEIKEILDYCNETEINFLFRLELARLLVKSESYLKSIQDAFCTDIIEHLPFKERTTGIKQDINILKANMIVKILWHSIQREGKTGGDLGLVFCNPVIYSSDYMTTKIENISARRGLLVQAKLKKYNENRGDFTVTQTELLPERMEYAAILLYDYKDLNNKDMYPFRWLPCNGLSFASLCEMLSKDNIPTSLQMNTSSILQRLVKGRIGTDSKNIIDKYIYPEVSQYLEITLTWKDSEKARWLLKKINSTLEQQRVDNELKEKI